jgi:hypothetical protein
LTHSSSSLLAYFGYCLQRRPFRQLTRLFTSSLLWLVVKQVCFYETLHTTVRCISLVQWEGTFNGLFRELTRTSDLLRMISIDKGGSDPWAGRFRYTGPLRPFYPLSPTRTVPDHIQKPDYAEDGIPRSEMRIRGSATIEVLPKEDIDIMRRVCKVIDILLRRSTGYNYKGCHLHSQHPLHRSSFNRLLARSSTLELQLSRLASPQTRLTASFTKQPSNVADTPRP